MLKVYIESNFDLNTTLPKVNITHKEQWDKEQSGFDLCPNVYYKNIVIHTTKTENIGENWKRMQELIYSTLVSVDQYCE